jgi:hypothetical protein
VHWSLWGLARHVPGGAGPFRRSRREWAGRSKGEANGEAIKVQDEPEPKPSKAKPKADDVRDGRGNAPVGKGRFVRTDDRKDKPQ